MCQFYPIYCITFFFPTYLSFSRASNSISVSASQHVCYILTERDIQTAARNLECQLDSGQEQELQDAQPQRQVNSGKTEAAAAQSEDSPVYPAKLTVWPGLREALLSGYSRFFDKMAGPFTLHEEHDQVNPSLQISTYTLPIGRSRTDTNYIPPSASFQTKSSIDAHRLDQYRDVFK